MPEDKWGYKSTPAQRTFGEQVMHIATTDVRLLGALGGKTAAPMVDMKQAATKADSMTALRASFAYGEAVIKELWNFTLKTWFTEGEHDPRITVIQVRPVEGYYWDNKHGNAVAGAKMLVGAVIGQTLDDSIEGTIRL